MPICAFCGREITPGTGRLYVLNSGKTLWFCSKKCRVYYLKRKRKPEKEKWTVAGRKAKQRRIALLSAKAKK